jgi:hypothetical protein
MTDPQPPPQPEVEPDGLDEMIAYATASAKATSPAPEVPAELWMLWELENNAFVNEVDLVSKTTIWLAFKTQAAATRYADSHVESVPMRVK